MFRIRPIYKNSTSKNWVARLIILFVILSASITFGQLQLDPGLMKGYDINLWPLFMIYESTNANQKMFDAAFSLFRYSQDSERGYSHSHFLPLYWYSRNKSSTDFRLVTGYYPSLLRSTSDKTAKSGNLKFIELAPQVEIWQMAWAENNFDNTYLFLIKHKWDGTLQKGHFILFPLFWNYFQPDKKSITLFPILWFKQTPTTSSKFFFPIHYRYTSDHEKIRSWFLLYWNRADTEFNNYSQTLFPIIWYAKNPDTTTFTVFPLFSARRYLSDSSHYYTYLFPLYYHSQNQYSETRSILFLWWDSRHGTSNRSAILFPLLWYFKSYDSFSFTFFPIYSTGTFNKIRYTMITPLYWHAHEIDDPDSCTCNCLIPFWGKAHSGGMRLTMIFPLYWNFSSGNSKYHHNYAYGIFPLYWHFQDSDEPHSDRSTVLFPLLWSGKNYYSKYLVIFPLFWHTAKLQYEKSVRTVFFPVFWNYSSAEHNETTLFPVFWYKNSYAVKSLTLLPLFSYSKNTVLGTGQIIITPFFWHKTSYDQSQTSLYRTATLFPIFSAGRSDNGGSSHLMITPLFYTAKSLPSRSQDRTTGKTIIFPLWFSFDSTSYYSRTLVPIFSFGYSPHDNSQHLVITPLYWNIKKPSTKNVTFFPLFWDRKKYEWDQNGTSKQSDHACYLFPLYYQRDRQDGYKNWSILYPFFQHSRKEENSQFHFVWPIIKYEHDVDLSYFRIAPILWYKNSPDREYFGLMPIYYYSRKPNLTYHSILWQVYTHENINGYKVSNDLLWKVLSLDKYNNGDHEYRVLQWLFYNVNREGTRKNGILPLYSWREKADGGKDFTCLAYFYNYHKRKLRDVDDYYEEVNIFWFIKILSNKKHVVNTYGREALKTSR